MSAEGASPDYLIAQAPPGKFHNPSGFYVRFIEDNAPVPDKFWTKRKRELQEIGRQTQEAEQYLYARMREAYEIDVCEQVENFIRRLPPEEYQRRLAEKRRQVKNTYRSLPPETVEEVAAGYVRREIRDGSQISLLSFDEFCRPTSSRATPAVQS